MSLSQRDGQERDCAALPEGQVDNGEDCEDGSSRCRSVSDASTSWIPVNSSDVDGAEDETQETPETFLARQKLALEEAQRSFAEMAQCAEQTPSSESDLLKDAGARVDPAMAWAAAGARSQIDRQLILEIGQLESNAYQVASLLVRFQDVVAKLGSGMVQRPTQLAEEKARVGLMYFREIVHPHALGWIGNASGHSASETCSLCFRSSIFGTDTGEWRCILGCEFSACGQCLTMIDMAEERRSQVTARKTSEHEPNVEAAKSFPMAAVQSHDEDNVDDECTKLVNESERRTPGRSAALPQPPYADDSWLWCADYDSPCCLRCGKRFHFGVVRHHCQSCGLAVCSECSDLRLPSLPRLRVCSSCFKDNMQQYHEAFNAGIHTETVWVSDSHKAERNTSESTEKDGDKLIEPAQTESWELVEVDSQNTQPPPSTLQLAVRPAPVAVLSGILMMKPRSFMKGKRKRYFVLDSNSMLASFAKFKYELGIGANTADEFPSTIVNMQVCTRVSLNDKPGSAIVFSGETSILPKIGISTPSDAFDLLFDSWEEAEEWYGTLTLMGMMCYACGKSIKFSKKPEERDLTCIIASNLPNRPRLYHRGCFVCSHRDCDSFHASGLVLLQSVGRLLSERQRLAGRLICRRHVMPQSESSTANQARTAVPSASISLRRNENTKDDNPKSGQSYQKSSKYSDNVVEINLLAGTKDAIKKLLSTWSTRQAQIEAQKKMQLRDVQPSRSLSAMMGSSDIEEDHDEKDQRVPSSSAFLNAATQGVLKMINSLDAANPSEKSRHYVHCEESETPYEITEFNPFQFDFLRRSAGIEPKAFAASFQECWDESDEGAASPSPLDGGRSGSLLFLTRDQRFVIKTIAYTERDMLQSILDEYIFYVDSNKNSLLVKICGLYEVKFTLERTYLNLRDKVTFIIMQNVMFNEPKIKIHHVYDLKGSYVDRRAVVNKGIGFANQFSGKTLKDMDLRRPLRVGKVMKGLVGQLSQDVMFLSRLQIMDYSLLIGIHDCDTDVVDYNRVADFVFTSSTARANIAYTQYFVSGEDGITQETATLLSSGIYGYGDPSTEDISASRSVYFVGIVDILQEWSSLKRTEAFVKSKILGKDPTGISAIEPNSYARRLVDCMFAWFKDR